MLAGIAFASIITVISHFILVALGEWLVHSCHPDLRRMDFCIKKALFSMGVGLGARLLRGFFLWWKFL